jgi:hypothetical protein
MSEEEVILVEDALWVIAKSIGLQVYDFNFSLNFTCRHPLDRPQNTSVVARCGPFEEYEQRYRELLDHGMTLINSPSEHLLGSELPHWYPLLEDLTPRSVCFDTIPSVDDVSSRLQWPVFIKGQRQTSRHNRSIAIAEGPDAFQRAMNIFQQDPILGWQKVICREYVPLRPVEDVVPDRIPSSFEFRTFWWRQELVGIGRYWWDGKPYEMTVDERKVAIDLAKEAALRLSVPFLVVDLAQTAEGEWIVIECNDGQESGYAGVKPLALWQRVLEIEKDRGN